ncbi:MAG: rRNA pseudouridine synthase [Oscillospiraceae bacterium]|nr:rRNA pseudouridine synthase [Oscillospiraceae bacterium]
MRLDKYISDAMGISRQDAKKLLSKGAVAIDGKVVKKGDAKVSDANRVLVNGKLLEYKQFVYIMLNKPKGVVSATDDKNDTTVVDLVKADYPKRNLFPAGRLDKTSTGFVLLTDDGDFAHDILAPKKHVSKEYIVTLDAEINGEIIGSFNSGVTLADGTLLKSAVLEATGDPMVVKVVLKQGVYHQIKRMFGVFDIGVNELHRTHIGAVELDDTLEPGQYRELTAEELEKIVLNSTQN